MEQNRLEIHVSAFLSPSSFKLNTYNRTDILLGEVWWDIAEPDPTCQIIIMSPVKAQVSGANCGDIVVAATHAGCYPSLIKDTFMIQFCCGSGDCGLAGVSKRDLDGETTAWPIVSFLISSLNDDA
jgi:hypothetical protein